MRFLKEAGITTFDPSADQYLTPKQLRDHCPAKFSLRILSWHIRDLSTSDLQDLYRELASYHPTSISFPMTWLADEPKIRALLEVAREMRGD